MGTTPHSGDPHTGGNTNWPHVVTLTTSVPAPHNGQVFVFPNYELARQFGLTVVECFAATDYSVAAASHPNDLLGEDWDAYEAGPRTYVGAEVWS